MRRHYQIEDFSGLDLRREFDRNEMLGPSALVRLTQHTPRCAYFRVQMLFQRERSPLPQALRTIFHNLARQLRHSRCRRSRPGRKRKDVQMRETTSLDQIERVLEH